MNRGLSSHLSPFVASTDLVGFSKSRTKDENKKAGGLPSPGRLQTDRLGFPDPLSAGPAKVTAHGPLGQEGAKQE